MQIPIFFLEESNNFITIKILDLTYEKDLTHHLYPVLFYLFA